MKGVYSNVDTANDCYLATASTTDVAPMTAPTAVTAALGWAALARSPTTAYRAVGRLAIQSGDCLGYKSCWVSGGLLDNLLELFLPLL